MSRKESKPVAVKEFIDPLSALAASPVTDVLDPLTALSISSTSQSKNKKLDEEYEKVLVFQYKFVTVPLPC